MSYVYIAILSWILLGVVALIEKNLVSQRIKNPTVFAVYTGIFAGFAALIFAPFAGATAPAHFWFDILCGVLFFCGVWSYLAALKHGEVSEILTLSGALTPIFSLVFTNYVLGISLSGIQATAFVFLLVGIILICYGPVRSSKVIFFAALAAVFLAAYYSLVKNAYTPFISNFAYVRLGTFFAAIVLLLSSRVRSEAMLLFRERFKRRRAAAAENLVTGELFIGKEIIGGAAFIVLNYAISIGNPALVNALEGAEYAFVFIAAVALTVFWPRLLREDVSSAAIVRKSVAVLLIFFGILTLNYK